MHLNLEIILVRDGEGFGCHGAPRQDLADWCVSLRVGHWSDLVAFV